MNFAIDPPILDKIAQMQQRVRWQDIAFQTRKIDQTQINIDDRQINLSEFSFLVVGDSGCEGNNEFSPQNQIAQIMLQHQNEVNFVLHTGDVVYEVGSKEYYHQNFIVPYREWIIGKETSKEIPYDKITFKKPFLPVMGNHDYYNLSLPNAAIAQGIKSLDWVRRSHRHLNIGLYGSNVGEAFARAFLDCVANFAPEELSQHLDCHYSAKFKDRLCLNYQPHQFTRLPNRYYSFRYGDIDFIALDSNTFNAPAPITDTAQGTRLREELLAQQEILIQEYNRLQSNSQKLDLGNPLHQNLMNDYQAKINQIRQKQTAIEKKLESEIKVIDYEQLNWFKNKLISSWSDSTVRGRIVYLHHSPYTTEAIHHHQDETLEVRHHLRQVLNQVQLSLGGYSQGKPLLDLVISGHAHCFEHLHTANTGQGDSRINWLICGGGGHSVRRQKSGDTAIAEMRNGIAKQVAQSRLFLGCKGHGIYKKQLYSCLRIDIQPSNSLRFKVRPLVAEQAYQNWYHYQPDAFVIN